MGNLDSLIWQSRFLDETPGDPVEGGNPRQVPGVCWSRVKPTETKDPILRLWSQEMAERLGLNDADSAVLGGSGIVEAWTRMRSVMVAINLVIGHINLGTVEQ